MVSFVGLARSQAAYVAAAEWLMTLHWSEDPQLVGHIVSLLTKVLALACRRPADVVWTLLLELVNGTTQAKMPERVAAFLVACANSEIMHKRQYGRALQVLDAGM